MHQLYNPCISHPKCNQIVAQDFRNYRKMKLFDHSLQQQYVIHRPKHMELNDERQLFVIIMTQYCNCGLNHLNDLI